MKTNKKTLNVALCALLALALPGMAAAQQMKTLSGHVPRTVTQFHLQPIGELSADTNLTLAISLPVQNEPGLESLLSQIYDPSSTNYHHYLSRGDFARRFGPSAADYQKVIGFAESNKLTIVQSYSNQMLLDVTGKASDIENAFHVKLRTYHHPFEKRVFFAPDTDPSVDSSVPIKHITGLDNYLIPRPALVQRELNTSAPAKPGLGSGPFGEYMGKDFRAAYVPGVTLDGTGQSVALFELDGYFTSDIIAYEAQAGLPSVTLTNISVDGGVPNPTGYGDPEVSLDIEMVISVATNASQVVVYEAPNGSGFVNTSVDELNRIASDDLAKQISSSWLIGDDPAYDVYYIQMALQGQTFFQASGDNGAYYSNQEFVQQWADDTNITLVGGTTLSTAGPGGPWQSETVWNWNSSGFGDAGSGGGTNWNGIPIPSWQQPVPMTINMGSTTLRNVPDVSLTADNIYVIFEQGFSGGFGGTSCAAPLWAAYTALVNQQATSRHLPTVGFLNPAIYSIGLSANYTNCFHDITTGNNTNLVVGNAYYAVPGYDLATGWGTPNGSNLINALTAAAPVSFYTHLSPPAPPYSTTLQTLNGGNPNGNWELFALNTQPFNNAEVTNGWVLSLTSANPIGFVADDGLTMTASSSSVLTNTDMTFTIGVTNYGPQASSNVVILDNLPAGFTFISATKTLGTVTNDGQTVTWNVTGNPGALGDGIGAQMTLKLQAPNAQEQAENSAEVTATTPDLNPADGSAYVIVNVTVPTPPFISSFGMGSGGTFNIPVGNSSGLPVVIQASTNLVNWVNIYTNASSSFIYTDTVTPGFPTRFYRATVQ